jgi:hypothetical protein
MRSGRDVCKMRKPDVRRRARERARAASFFPSLSKRDDLGLQAHMFIQDLYGSIIPYSRKHSGVAEVKGVEDARNKALDLCNSLARYDNRDESYTIVEAIEGVAMHLAWGGRALFEIIRPTDGDATLALNSFSSRRLLHLPGVYAQFIPRADRRYGMATGQHGASKTVNLIPARDVWRIEMPRALGGYFGYRRLLWALKRFPSVGPDFLTSDIEQGQFTPTFDPAAYSEAEVRYISRVTRRWGWNRRDFTSKYDTEFYTFYRTLKFKQAQAIIREHIVGKLNSLLSTLGIGAEIALKDLLTSADIAVIRADVASGKLHYGEALRRLG